MATDTSAPAVTRLDLKAPLTGVIVPIEQVPDPVFAQKMVGEGVSIDPLSDHLLAPCDGEVIHLHAAGHAVTMEEYLKTAGDEAEISDEAAKEISYEPTGGAPVRLRDPLAPEKARGMIDGLGGRDNIVKVDAVAETRLRVKVKNADVVDENVLTEAGISGFVDVGGGTLHLLAGLNADQYAAEIRGQLAAAPALAGR